MSRRPIPFLLLALLLFGCQNSETGESATTAAQASAPPLDTSPAIVTINGTPITEKEVDHFVSQLERPVHPDPKIQRKIVLDEMVKRVLLAQYAKDAKLDELLDVYLALKRQRETILVAAARRAILKDYPAPTEEELKARYEQQISQQPKDEYKVQHIITKTEEDAKALVAELKKGKDFTALAKAKSTGPTKKKGGELGWVRQGLVVPAFLDAVVKLKKGKFTEVPVQSRFGWHIIKLNDVRKITAPPFDKVKNRVAGMIQEERVNAKLKELHMAANVVVAGAQENAPAEDKMGVGTSAPEKKEP